MDADVEDNGPASGGSSLPRGSEPLPAAGNVPDGDCNRAFRCTPFHQLPEASQAVVATQLQDRVDGPPGLGLQRNQGIEFLVAQGWRLFEDYVGADPQAEGRVFGMQVVRRTDREIVRGPP
jgi:hypothetical protein